MRRSLICSQRPSASSASKVRAPIFAGSSREPATRRRVSRAVHHLGVAHARRDEIGRKVVQRAEFRVAEHEAVVRVPEHEGLGDGIDRVAQPRIRPRRLLGERALVGDVDGDAYEVLAGVAGLAHELGAGAQPNPLSGGALDAEVVVDDRGARRGEPVGEAVEIAIIRMNEGVHLAEGQEFVPPLVAEQLVHRVRPVYAAAGDVPIPQSTSPAAQRRVDPALDLFTDLVCLTRPRGLEPVGAAEAEDHQHRRSEQRDLAGRAAAPFGEERLDGLDDRDLPRCSGQVADGRKSLPPSRELDLHDACAIREGRQRLRLAEKVRQRPGARLGGGVRGEHVAGGIGDEKRAILREDRGRQRSHKRAKPRLRAHRVAPCHACRKRRDDIDFGDCLRKRVPVALPDLEISADAERDEKDAEKRRNREAEPGLDLLQAEARRRRARHAQNRSRAHGHASGVRPRHPRCHFGFPVARFGGRSASSRITINRITGR